MEPVIGLLHYTLSFNFHIPQNQAYNIRFFQSHTSITLPKIPFTFPNTPIYVIEILIILISSSGFSLYTFVFSILCTTSMPATALPKIVCLSSSHDYNLHISNILH
jgi:hypothetical protein